MRLPAETNFKRLPIDKERSNIACCRNILMLQIKDLLLHSEKLKTSAKNNTEQDFEFSFYDNTDDALIEGLSQNQDFFSLLLSNDDIKHRVLGVFLHEVYKELREQQ